MTTPHSILVLDDETGITRITSSILKMSKYNVLAFNNPIEALEATKTTDITIAIAIVDYMMPEMEGNEFIQNFKKIHKSTKFIMLSAKKLSVEERKELFELNVVFLTKPFKPRELLDAVTTVLARET